MSEVETMSIRSGMPSYLVDCNIVGGNPGGEKPNTANEWRNGVRNPLPDEGGAGNDHEELVTAHGPTVDRLHRTSGV